MTIWRAPGEFTCSNPLLNRIYQNIVWGVSGNYRSIPTDCPQRDERQGWLGDRSAESQGRDVPVQHRRAARQVAAGHGRRPKAQRQRLGRLPGLLADLLGQRHLAEQHGASSPGHCATSSPTSASSRSHYASAKKWMDYMAGFVTNGIIARDSYGDWCVPPEDPKLIHSNDPKRKTDKALLATAYFYHDAALMARYATLLGKTDDAQHFAALAGEAQGGVQPEVLPRRRRPVRQRLADFLRAAAGLRAGARRRARAGVRPSGAARSRDETHGHIGTGLIGGQWLMRVLTDGGRADLAYTIATQTDLPELGLHGRAKARPPSGSCGTATPPTRR